MSEWMVIEYIGYVICVTSVWVYLFKGFSFTFLCLAMFFPFLCVFPFLISNAMEEEEKAKYFEHLWSFSFEIILETFFGGILDIIIVFNAVFISYVLNWTRSPPPSSSSSSSFSWTNWVIYDGLLGFVRAAGEEAGWRCFLLPLLISYFSSSSLSLSPSSHPMSSLFWATMVIGNVWGMYHIPIMVLLSHSLPSKTASRTIFFQYLSCVLLSFPYTFIAVRSNFSLFPSAFMHFFWNRLNPYVLGSVYTQKGGIYGGERWKVNGEGAAGCMSAVMVSIVLMSLI